MQQTLEQYDTPCSGSREPAHCTNTISLGTDPSDGRLMSFVASMLLKSQTINDVRQTPATHIPEEGIGRTVPILLPR